MDRKFLDVNAISVFLDESHPGHPYLRDALEPGFVGTFRVVLNAPLIIRARWVLVSRWGVDPAMADEALEDLAQTAAPLYAGGDGSTVARAIELSRETSHGVYDSFAVALAEAGGATHFVTTDLGLRRVCNTAGIEYENPVPRDVLREFGVAGREA